MALSTSGSDWVIVRFFDLTNLEFLPDILNDIKFSSLIWSDENSGIFYSKFPGDKSLPENKQTKNQKIFFHTMKTEQNRDELKQKQVTGMESLFRKKLMNMHLLLHF